MFLRGLNASATCQAAGPGSTTSQDIIFCIITLLLECKTLHLGRQQNIPIGPATVQFSGMFSVGTVRGSVNPG